MASDKHLHLTGTAPHSFTTIKSLSVKIQILLQTEIKVHFLQAFVSSKFKRTTSDLICPNINIYLNVNINFDIRKLVHSSVVNLVISMLHIGSILCISV